MTLNRSSPMDLVDSVGSKTPSWLMPTVLLCIGWGLAIRQLDLEWSINPEYQYGWIVPLLTLILWYRAWPRRPSPTAPAASPGMSVCLMAGLMILAFPLRIIQEANPDWRPVSDYFTAQAVLVTALIIDYSGGRAWLRHFAFPLLFPFIAVPWPSGPEQAIVQDLQRCIAAIGVEGASWMGWSAFQNGNLIVLAHGTVGVNEACSGIRSLQSSLMVSLFLGDYFQLTTLWRGGLVLLALLAAFILNAVRAFFLIVLMDLHGPNALSTFHDPAGFGIAIANLLLLWIVAKFWAPPPASGTIPTQPPAGGRRFPVRLLVLLMIAWLGAEILNQTWYVWHERNSASAPLWTLRWPPPRPGFRDEAIDEVTRTYLRYDEGRHGTWRDASQWEIYFFTWNPGRATVGLAQSHRPDICLPAAGFILKEQLGVKVIESNGLAFPVNRFVFQDPSSTQLYYVFQAITDDRIWRNPVAPDEDHISLSYRMRSAWEGRRNPGQRSLLVINHGANNLGEAEAGFRQLLSDSVISP